MVVWDKAKDTIIFDQKISRPMQPLGPLLKEETLTTRYNRNEFNNKSIL
jgi:hypothetical protein